MRRRHPHAVAILVLVGIALAAVSTAAQESQAPPVKTVADASSPSAEVRFVAADESVLQTIREQGGLQRTPQPTSWTAYLSFLLRRLRAKLYRTLIGALAHLTSVASVLRWGGIVLVWVVLVLVLLGLAAFLSRLFGRQRQEALKERLTSEPSAVHLARGATEWRAEVESQLASGDLAAALAAAWWWLARSLAADRVDPAWTSRELLDQARLQRSRRRQLLPLVRRLDALVYGPRPPALAQVRQFVDQLAPLLEVPSARSVSTPALASSGSAP